MTSSISQNPIFINTTDKSGSHGIDGKDGANGCGVGYCGGQDGEDGTDGHSGKTVGKVTLSMLATDTHTQIQRLSSITRFNPKAPNFFISVTAKGGNGGRGGAGGNGGAGAQGATGISGYQMPGGQGGPGGHGGNGGNGGNGGHGGNGGRVIIRVNKPQVDLFLLMRVNVDAGSGGDGGVAGEGGFGGPGGTGGAGSSWTTTEFKRDASGNSYTETHYHSTSSGCAGVYGYGGKNGEPGCPGRDGSNGKIDYVICNPEKTETVYRKIFQLKLEEYTCNIDGGVCEPGCEYFISDVWISNSSEMPLSKLDVFPFLGIQNNEKIKFNRKNKILITEEIPSDQKVKFVGKLQFRIKKIDPSTIPPNTILCRSVPLVIKCEFPRTRQYLSFPLKTSHLAIQYPLKMSHISKPPVVDRNSLCPIAVRITLLTEKELGEFSTSRRKVVAVLSMDNPFNKDTYFQEESSNKEIPLSKPIQFFAPIIKKEENRYFAGTLRFSSSVPSYQSLKFQISLYLANREEIDRIEIIQRNHFTISISETFQINPNADLLLCTNRETPNKIIQQWKKFFSQMGVEIMIWDLSLYKGFHFEQVLGDETLKTSLANKVVIIFNKQFKGKNGLYTLPSECFSSRDVFSALSESNIGLYVIGGKKELASFYQPHPPLKAVSIFDTKEQFLTSLRDGTASLPAKVLFKENSLFKPNTYRLQYHLNQTIESIQAIFPQRSFFIIFEVKPEIIEEGINCTWLLGEGTFYEGIPGDENYLTHNMVDDALIYSESASHYFQVIKLLPFERKLALLTSVEDKKKFDLLKEAILSDLLEEAQPFWECTAEIDFDEQRSLSDLPKLCSLVEKSKGNRDNRIKSSLQFFIAHYKAIMDHVNSPSLFQQVKELFVDHIFFPRCAVDIMIEELSNSHQIYSEFLKEAVKEVRKKGKEIGFKELARRCINPYFSNQLFRGNHFSLQRVMSIVEIPSQKEQKGIKVKMPSYSQTRETLIAKSKKNCSELKRKQKRMKVSK